MKKIFKHLNIEIVKYPRSGGFVILFAATLSGLLLSIALGVAHVALKEIKFGTSARDTNDAFFAADAGIECALMYDKDNPAENVFVGTAPVMFCARSSITVTGSAPNWSFIVTRLGNNRAGCAKVTVFKDDFTNPPNTYTTLVSKGYNIGDSNCNSTSANLIEREIRLSY